MAALAARYMALPLLAAESTVFGYTRRRRPR